MAHNEFEHIVQGRFQGFESAPPEAVWTSINKIRNGRKKRLIILWWILPLTTAACLGMGIYLGIGNLGKSKLSSALTFTNIEATLNPVKQIIESNSPVANPSISAIDPKAQNATSIQAEDTNSNGNTSTTKVPKTGSTKNRIPTKKERSSASQKIVVKPITTSQITPARNAELATSSLYPIELQSLRLPNEDLSLCQAYGTGDYLNNREHSLGLRIGGFISVTQKKSTVISSPLADPGADLESSEFASYTRFLEVSPYYEFSTNSSRFSFQANALYATSRLNLTTSTNFPGTRHSIGLGTGTSYALLNKRFSLSLYVNLQTELGFNRFGGSSGFATNGGNPAQVTTNANGVPPASYRQFLLAGESGIRCNYILNRSRWSINASFGYRNYFWQQNVEYSNFIHTPNLFLLNAGIRFTL